MNIGYNVFHQGAARVIATPSTAFYVNEKIKGLNQKVKGLNQKASSRKNGKIRDTKSHLLVDIFVLGGKCSSVVYFRRKGVTLTI